MKIPKNYAIALTAALGLFMAVLDNTIVNVALIPMANALKTDLNSIQWVITGYFLAQAAVIPAAGYFSNRYGMKRVFIISLALFTLGSLMCGLAQDVTLLIIFRVLQGIGGGALFPLGQAITFQAFPGEKRAAAGALIGVPILLAPVFGPTVGGLLTVSFGWEYIFFINVPVGMLAVYLVYRVFPADEAKEKRASGRFDYVGLSLSILGVLALVYSFALVSQTRPGSATVLNPRGDIYGWGYWLVWTLMGIGAALLVAFAVYELRYSKDPVMDLRLYKRYNYTVASVISWFSAVVVFGSLFMLPVFLEQVRLPHLSALDAGLALMPQGIAAAAAVAFSGRFYNRLGVRTLVVIGSVLLIISSWQLTYLTPDTDGFGMMPWLILRGFGFGMTFIPVQTLALTGITGRDLPKASSLFNVTRQIFSSVGLALLLTLFVQQTSSHAGELRSQALQSGVAGQAFDPNSPAAKSAIEQLTARAGTAGMNDVFLFVTIGTVLLLLVALALPGSKTQYSELSRESQGEGEGQRRPEPAVMME